MKKWCQFVSLSAWGNLWNYWITLKKNGGKIMVTIFARIKILFYVGTTTTKGDASSGIVVKKKKKRPTVWAECMSYNVCT